MSTQREVRYLEATEVRAKGGSPEDPTLRIEGYAAVFNRTAKLPKYRENIKPGAFTRAIRDAQDVVCLFNHNSNLVLGRTTSGTLRLSQDDRGLHYECDMPNTQTGRDTHESIKRGDINGCSFAFTVPDGGQEWSEQEESGVYYIQRNLTDLNLHDVSPVTYPTYGGTDVYARSEETCEAPAELRSAVDQKNAERGMMDMKAIDVPAKKEQPFDPTSAVASTNEGETEKRPYSKPSDVPENVPAAHKAQFMEVFNSAHAAAKKDGKSDKDADASAFAQAWGVINKNRSEAGEAEIRWQESEAVVDGNKDMSEQEEIDLEEGFDRAMNEDDFDPPYDPFGLTEDHVDGDCENEMCSCQNRMYGFGMRSALVAEEFRAGTRTKRVGGKDLTAKSFAFVGDPSRTETWKYPIHDASHVRNALARWGQHKGIPSDKEAGVLRKIHAAAKRFGIDVADERSWKPEVQAPQPWHTSYKAFQAGLITAEECLRYSAEQDRHDDGIFAGRGETANSKDEHMEAAKYHSGQADSHMDAASKHFSKSKEMVSDESKSGANAEAGYANEHAAEMHRSAAAKHTTASYSPSVGQRGNYHSASARIASKTANRAGNEARKASRAAVRSY
ncbi:Caudovirus prohead serine protease [uncultured archaeon]|nr:Caudovirus prohead serine protease [uncultured archaeon]